MATLMTRKTTGTDTKIDFGESSNRTLYTREQGITGDVAKYGENYSLISNKANSLNSQISEADKRSLLNTGHQTVGTIAKLSAESVTKGYVGSLMQTSNVFEDMFNLRPSALTLQARKLMEESEASNASAKNGLGKLETFGIDVLQSSAEMLGDFLLGGGTGQAGTLTAMAARIFPRTYTSSRDMGMSKGSSFINATGKTAIELFTETLSGLGIRDVGFGKYYNRITNKTAFIDKAITAIGSRLGMSTNSVILGNAISSFLGEASEEVIASVLGYAFDSTAAKIDKGWVKEEESFWDAVASGFEQGLVAGASALGSTVIHPQSYRYLNTNSEVEYTEKAKDGTEKKETRPLAVVSESYAKRVDANNKATLEKIAKLSEELDRAEKSGAKEEYIKKLQQDIRNESLKIQNYDMSVKTYKEILDEVNSIDENIENLRNTINNLNAQKAENSEKSFEGKEDVDKKIVEYGMKLEALEEQSKQAHQILGQTFKQGFIDQMSKLRDGIYRQEAGAVRAEKAYEEALNAEREVGSTKIFVDTATEFIDNSENPADAKAEMQNLVDAINNGEINSAEAFERYDELIERYDNAENEHTESENLRPESEERNADSVADATEETQSLRDSVTDNERRGTSVEERSEREVSKEVEDSEADYKNLIKRTKRRMRGKTLSYSQTTLLNGFIQSAQNRSASVAELQSKIDEVLGTKSRAKLSTTRVEEKSSVANETASDVSFYSEQDSNVKKATMYFSYNGQQRSDVKSRTTFEAIKSGERTATTRLRSFGENSMRFWGNVKVGDTIDFSSTKDVNSGEHVNVTVDNVYTIKSVSENSWVVEDSTGKTETITREQWSKAEGWSEESKWFSEAKAGDMWIRYHVADQANKSQKTDARSVSDTRSLLSRLQERIAALPRNKTFTKTEYRKAGDFEEIPYLVPYVSGDSTVKVVDKISRSHPYAAFYLMYKDIGVNFHAFTGKFQVPVNTGNGVVMNDVYAFTFKDANGNVHIYMSEDIAKLGKDPATILLHEEFHRALMMSTLNNKRAALHSVFKNALTTQFGIKEEFFNNLFESTTANYSKLYSDNVYKAYEEIYAEIYSMDYYRLYERYSKNSQEKMSEFEFYRNLDTMRNLLFGMIQSVSEGYIDPTNVQELISYKHGVDSGRVVSYSIEDLVRSKNIIADSTGKVHISDVTGRERQVDKSDIERAMKSITPFKSKDGDVKYRVSFNGTPVGTFNYKGEALAYLLGLSSARATMLVTIEKRAWDRETGAPKFAFNFNHFTDKIEAGAVDVSTFAQLKKFIANHSYKYGDRSGYMESEFTGDNDYLMFSENATTDFLEDMVAKDLVADKDAHSSWTKEELENFRKTAEEKLEKRLEAIKNNSSENSNFSMNNEKREKWINRKIYELKLQSVRSSKAFSSEVSDSMVILKFEDGEEFANFVKTALTRDTERVPVNIFGESYSFAYMGAQDVKSNKVRLVKTTYAKRMNAKLQSMGIAMEEYNEAIDPDSKEGATNWFNPAKYTANRALDNSPSQKQRVVDVHRAAVVDDISILIDLKGKFERGVYKSIIKDNVGDENIYVNVDGKKVNVKEYIYSQMGLDSMENWISEDENFGRYTAEQIIDAIERYEMALYNASSESAYDELLNKGYEMDGKNSPRIIRGMLNKYIKVRKFVVENTEITRQALDSFELTFTDGMGVTESEKFKNINGGYSQVRGSWGSAIKGMLQYYPIVSMLVKSGIYEIDDIWTKKTGKKIQLVELNETVDENGNVVKTPVIEDGHYKLLIDTIMFDSMVKFASKKYSSREEWLNTFDKNDFGIRFMPKYATHAFNASEESKYFYLEESENDEDDLLEKRGLKRVNLNSPLRAIIGEDTEALDDLVQKNISMINDMASSLEATLKLIDADINASSSTSAVVANLGAELSHSKIVRDQIDSTYSRMLKGIASGSVYADSSAHAVIIPDLRAVFDGLAIKNARNSNNEKLQSVAEQMLNDDGTIKDDGQYKIGRLEEGEISLGIANEGDSWVERDPTMQLSDVNIMKNVTTEQMSERKSLFDELIESNKDGVSIMDYSSKDIMYHNVHDLLMMRLDADVDGDHATVVQDTMLVNAWAEALKNNIEKNDFFITTFDHDKAAPRRVRADTIYESIMSGVSTDGIGVFANTMSKVMQTNAIIVRDANGNVDVDATMRKRHALLASLAIGYKLSVDAYKGIAFPEGLKTYLKVIKSLVNYSFNPQYASNDGIKNERKYAKTLVNALNASRNSNSKRATRLYAASKVLFDNSKIGSKMSEKEFRRIFPQMSDYSWLSIKEKKFTDAEMFFRVFPEYAEYRLMIEDSKDPDKEFNRFRKGAAIRFSNETFFNAEVDTGVTHIAKMVADEFQNQNDAGNAFYYELSKDKSSVGVTFSKDYEGKTKVFENSSGGLPARIKYIAASSLVRDTAKITEAERYSITATLPSRLAGFNSSAEFNKYFSKKLGVNIKMVNQKGEIVDTMKFLRERCREYLEHVEKQSSYMRENEGAYATTAKELYAILDKYQNLRECLTEEDLVRICLFEIGACSQVYDYGNPISKTTGKINKSFRENFIKSYLAYNEQISTLEAGKLARNYLDGEKVDGEYESQIRKADSIAERFSKMYPSEFKLGAFSHMFSETIKKLQLESYSRRIAESSVSEIESSEADNVEENKKESNEVSFYSDEYVWSEEEAIAEQEAMNMPAEYYEALMAEMEEQGIEDADYDNFEPEYTDLIEHDVTVESIEANEAILDMSEQTPVIDAESAAEADEHEVVGEFENFEEQFSKESEKVDEAGFVGNVSGIKTAEDYQKSDVKKYTRDKISKMNSTRTWTTTENIDVTNNHMRLALDLIDYFNSIDIESVEERKATFEKIMKAISEFNILVGNLETISPNYASKRLKTELFKLIKIADEIRSIVEKSETSDSKFNYEALLDEESLVNTLESARKIFETTMIRQNAANKLAVGAIATMDSQENGGNEYVVSRLENGMLTKLLRRVGFKNEKMVKNRVSKHTIAKTFLSYSLMQMNAQSFLKCISGFNGNENSLGYYLADMSLKSEFNMNKMRSEWSKNFTELSKMSDDVLYGTAAYLTLQAAREEAKLQGVSDSDFKTWFKDGIKFQDGTVYVPVGKDAIERGEDCIAKLESLAKNYNEEVVKNWQEVASDASKKFKNMMLSVHGIDLDKAETWRTQWYYPFLRDSDETTGRAEAHNINVEDTRFGNKNNIQRDGKAIYLQKANTTMQQYIDQMSTQIAYSDFFDVFRRTWSSEAKVDIDYRYETPTEITKSNLRTAFKKMYGSGAFAIIENYYDDITGNRQQNDEPINDIVRSLRNTASAAVIPLNIGVWIKQSASIMNAAPYLDIKKLLREYPNVFKSANPEAIERMLKEVPECIRGQLLQRYNQQMIDPAYFQDLGETYHNKFIEGASDLSTKAFKGKFDATRGVNYVDMASVLAVERVARETWLAMEEHQKADYAGIENDNDYATWCYEIIAMTQPNGSRYSKAEVQRTNNELERAAFGMYKSQPIQNFSMIMTSIFEGNTEKLAKAGAGLVASALIFGLFSMIASGVKHKRDKFEKNGKLSIGRMSASYAENVIDALAGTAIGVNYPVSVLLNALDSSYYVGTIGTDIFQNVVNAVQYTVKIASNPSATNLRKAATYWASTFGMPLGQAYDVVNSLVMTPVDMVSKTKTGDITREIDRAVINAMKSAKSEKNNKAKLSTSKNSDSTNPYSSDKYGAGNIDLTSRPKYVNKDGSISTVRSMSFEEDGMEVLIPTVVMYNGKPRILSDDDAIKWYHRTGEYLGKFKTVKQANAYAEKLHKDQEAYYVK